MQILSMNHRSHCHGSFYFINKNTIFTKERNRIIETGLIPIVHNEYKEKYNIKIRGQDEHSSGDSEGDKKPRAGNVLVVNPM